MEGTGFRSEGGNDYGSGSDSSPWPSHNHHHHHSDSSSSFVPGLLLGVLGGAFGTSWWRSQRDASPVPPFHQPHAYDARRSYYPGGWQQPQPQSYRQSYPFYSPLNPPTFQPPPRPSSPANVPFLPDPVFVMPAPPPTPARKKACSVSCCLCFLLLIGIVIAAILVPKPGSHDVKVVVRSASGSVSCRINLPIPLIRSAIES